MTLILHPSQLRVILLLKRIWQCLNTVLIVAMEEVAIGM